MALVNEILELFEVLHGNISCDNQTKWMFRAVSDEFVDDIIKSGFMFPSAKKPYVYGCGGIGFTIKINDALNYAYKASQSKFTHIFSCPLPIDYITVCMNELPLKNISHNILIPDIINGNTRGAEFILHGLEYTFYKSVDLLWLKYKTKKY